MKKRILHILNSNAYSGAENVVFSIIKNIKEYDFAYVARKGEIQSRLEKEGITYYLVDNMNVRELRKIIKDFKPDLIHAHDFTASILVAFSGIKIPIISHLHNNPLWIKRYSLKSIVYYIATGKFVKILAVSNAVFYEYIFGKSLIKKSKVIANPINSADIIKLADKENVPQYDIIALGRLSEQKNPKLFVDIVRGCIQNNEKIKAVMVGSGELYQDIQQYIIDINIQNHIDMVGFKDNPYPYLKQAKILCIPSSWEGFGLVAVEALILGKPVVAAAVGGLPDIINESCGKICYSKNEYEEEIMKLLLDANYYKKKSQAAIERISCLEKEIDYYNTLKCIYQEVL